MAVPAYATRIMLDQYDVSADNRQVSVELMAEALDVSAFQTAARLLSPGAPSGKIATSGYWSGTAVTGLDPLLYARLGAATNGIVSVLFDTRATGNPAYVQQSTWNGSAKIGAPIKDVITLDAEWQAFTNRGLSVAHGTVAGTGGIGATGVDFATAGTLGGFAVCHVRSISGTATGATIALQSSAAGAMTSPTTHGTFTFSAVGAYLITWSGATGRYIRPNCTSLGGATNFGVTIIAGVTGVTG